MKKFFVVLLVFIPVFAFAQAAVSLDAALLNSTTYLNGRIPAKTKVVVLNFTSNWPQLSDYIIEELIGYLVNEGSLTVVDRANLETIRKELNFQLSGEVSDETAQSIGKKLGAQTIISGGITAIGSSYRLRIRAISVETAQILGMQNVDVAQDSRMAALTGTAFANSTASSSSSSSSNTAAVQKSNPTLITVLPNVGWIPDSDGKTVAKISTAMENIDGQNRELMILTVEIAKGSGWRWGHFRLENEDAILGKLKQGSGVRFKVVGDGKAWNIQFGTNETNTDYCHYQHGFTPKSGKVTEVNVPFTQLKQPSWGKKASFVKNNIFYLVFERGTDQAAGVSTIKIFDFEVY